MQSFVLIPEPETNVLSVLDIQSCQVYMRIYLIIFFNGKPVCLPLTCLYEINQSLKRCKRHYATF